MENPEQFMILLDLLSRSSLFSSIMTIGACTYLVTPLDIPLVQRWIVEHILLSHPEGDQALQEEEIPVVVPGWDTGFWQQSRYYARKLKPRARKLDQSIYDRCREITATPNPKEQQIEALFRLFGQSVKIL